MNTLLMLAFTNAVMVLPLALGVYFLTRLVRNAAVRHVLWVVVLVKFVAPPIFSLPMTVELPTGVSVIESASVAALPCPTPAAELGANSSAACLPNCETPPDRVSAASDTLPDKSSGTYWSTAQRRLGVGWLALSRLWGSQPLARTGLLALWIMGSLTWIARQIWHGVRFEQLLASTPGVPTRLQQQTDALAADLGLKQSPRVFVIDAAVSPMLWGFGRRARLLFPADLALRLDDEARATLITHELAHYSRGDHMVRVLELIATAVFWWHPVLWWTRSQIEQAEEECCDAWVVRQFPHVPRRYAEALLDTIDFLCESQRALPPLASGLGQAPFLRRRLIQIMQGPKLQPVDPRVRMAILLVAAAILPLQPFVFATPSRAVVKPASILPQVTVSLPTAVQPIALPLPSESPNLLNPADRPLPPKRRTPAVRSQSRGLGLVWSTAVSPDGRFALQITTARRLILHDLQNSTTIDLSHQLITAAAFVPDEPWFVTAGSDGKVAVWDVNTGRQLRLLAQRPQPQRTIAVAPDGRALCVGGVDGSVVTLDPSTGEELFSVPRSSVAVNCVRYSPNGRWLAIATGDWTSTGRGRVLVYEAADGRLQASLPCASAPGAMAFASDEELIVGLFEGHVQLWNLTTRQVVAESWTDKSVVATAAFSPDNPALREITFAAVESDPEQAAVPFDFWRVWRGTQP